VDNCVDKVGLAVPETGSSARRMEKGL